MKEEIIIADDALPQVVAKELEQCVKNWIASHINEDKAIVPTRGTLQGTSFPMHAQLKKNCVIGDFASIETISHLAVLDSTPRCFGRI